MYLFVDYYCWGQPTDWRIQLFCVLLASVLYHVPTGINQNNRPQNMRWPPSWSEAKCRSFQPTDIRIIPFHCCSKTREVVKIVNSDNSYRGVIKRGGSLLLHIKKCHNALHILDLPVELITSLSENCSITLFDISAFIYLYYIIII